MIEIRIDTRALDTKISHAKNNIAKGITNGTLAGVNSLETEIDTFMFVPLAFKADAQQRANETTVLLNASLNIPRERKFVRRDKKYGNRYERPRKKQKARRWQEWVKQLAQTGKNTVSKSVASKLKIVSQ